MNEKQENAPVPGEAEGREEAQTTRFVILVGDGMADLPIESLGWKTALEAARTPAMDRLARLGEVGRVLTIPEGFPPGSDVANMSLMGYDPRTFYTGRGPLEAAAVGVSMNPEDVAFRCNLVTLHFHEGRVYMSDYSAGHISTEEAHALINDLSPLVSGRSFDLLPGVSYRHILIWHGGPEGIPTVPPHDFTGADVTEAWHTYEEEPILYELLTKAITFFHRHPVNEKRRAHGKPPANSLWLWGQGRRPRLATIPELYEIDGAVVAAVDLIKGLGTWAGLEVILVPGATGYLDTNYRGKAEAALRVLSEKDLVFVHVEAPDEASHSGDVREKVRAIERFDKEVVGPLVDGLNDRGIPYRLLLVTDHYTPIRLRTHAPGPVPYLIYDSINPQENPDAAYSEPVAERSPIFIEKGHELLSRLIGKPPNEVELDPKKK